MNKFLDDIFFKSNPVFNLLLGLCPTLAVTTSAKNGLGMGIASLFVLICSNSLIALIRKIVPDQIRIPIFITIIASFVTIIDLLMSAYLPDLHRSLGIFIPLIVVNCMILGRAEAFACKNSIFASLLDGLNKGFAFTVALVLIGIIRELLGNGSIFNFNILGNNYQPVLLAILPPGGFIVLGFILAVLNSKKA